MCVSCLDVMCQLCEIIYVWCPLLFVVRDISFGLCLQIYACNLCQTQPLDHPNVFVEDFSAAEVSEVMIVVKLKFSFCCDSNSASLLILNRAEPKKKKKVDPRRELMVKERLKKKVKKLEKIPPEFIPIEDFIPTAKCFDEIR